MTYWPMRAAVDTIAARNDFMELWRMRGDCEEDLDRYPEGDDRWVGTRENILRIDRAIGQSVRRLQEEGVLRKPSASQSKLPGPTSYGIPGVRMSACLRLADGVDDAAFEQALKTVIAEGHPYHYRMVIALGKKRVVPKVLPPRELTLAAADQRRLMERACLALEGIGDGLNTFGAVHPDVTVAEAATWITALSAHRRGVEQLIKHLKKEKITHGQD